MSSKDKLLLVHKLRESDLDSIVPELSKFYQLIIPSDYSRENLIKLITDVQVVLAGVVTGPMVEAARELKMIQTLGAGINHLDLEAISNTSIRIGNSHSNAMVVAEHGVAMMLALARKLAAHDAKMRTGQWFKPSGDETDLPWLSTGIHGKKLGIVGFGHIGKAVHKLLGGFDMDTLVFDRTKDHGGVKNVDLAQLLSQADYIVVTIPLTAATRNLISDAEFGMMNKTAILVNISRGEVIDKTALWNCLKNYPGISAGLDVWYPGDPGMDGFSEDHRFDKLDNLLMSPYRAATLGGASPHLAGVIENLKNWALKGELIHEVDSKEGY